jgi:hypothetical protein
MNRLIQTFNSLKERGRINFPVKVWLDLEETVIDEWGNYALLFHSCELIAEFLNEFGVNDIGIWSFAIYNDADIEKFKVELMPRLETILNVSVSDIISVRQMIKQIGDFQKLRFQDECDFISVYGKQKSFIDSCIFSQKWTTCVLIDDVVRTSYIYDTESDVEIITLRI